MRPDFIRQIVGDKADKPGVGIITQFCNLLANGQAPPELIPYLGGAAGTVLDKKSKRGEQDARPI